LLESNAASSDIVDVENSLPSAPFLAAAASSSDPSPDEIGYD
jgi:hypothetical protein